MTDLATRRSDAAASLSALEREQGAALLDGQDFDPSTITAKHGELAVIAAAESVANERQRAAEEAEAARLTTAARADAAAELANLIASIGATEDLAGAIALALKEVEASAARLIAYGRAAGIREPATLAKLELRKSLSRILAEAIHRGTGSPHYGDLRLPAAGPRPAADALLRALTATYSPQPEGGSQ